MSKKRLNYYFNKISWYSIYVDCFSRIISEIGVNDSGNYISSDFPNMVLILEKYSKMLRKYVSQMETYMEFGKY